MICADAHLQIASVIQVPSDAPDDPGSNAEDSLDMARVHNAIKIPLPVPRLLCR